jgi:hypothetical protein
MSLTDIVQHPDAPVYIVFLLSLLLMVWIIRLELRLRTLMLGKDAQSLEQTISAITAAHRLTEQYKKKNDEVIRDLDARIERCASGVATVRFNALSGDTSGKQSFATAIINERGNGVVFSSLYSRDNTRVYAKEVRNFTSDHELTSEEKQAIAASRSIVA